VVRVPPEYASHCSVVRRRSKKKSKDKNKKILQYTPLYWKLNVLFIYIHKIILGGTLNVLNFIYSGTPAEKFENP
jgi:hypothetical protein